MFLYLLFHLEALRTDVPLKYLPLFWLRVGLPVNQDVVNATPSISEAKAAGLTPPLTDEQTGQNEYQAIKRKSLLPCFKLLLIHHPLRMDRSNDLI